MKARNRLEIQAEAEQLNPWLLSPEADTIAAADTARTEAERQGYALAALRKEGGLTQAQVARTMGVGQARISQIEHGQIDSLELLRSYISAIGGALRLQAVQGPMTVTLDLPSGSSPDECEHDAA